MPVSPRLVSLLLFGSGFAALVYQTAWQRTLRLTFGASTGASAAVLAVFLGGLGLGGLWFGRRVEREGRPLFLYGNLELGIALLAAVSPFLSGLTHEAYLALGGSQALGGFGATTARLLGTLIVIGPAAVLMGGTLPAAARAVVAEDDAGRRGLARLYALNTVGAVFGALVGPLVLFSVLGTRLTLWTAAIINVIVALVARSVGRAAKPIPVARGAAVEAPRREAKATPVSEAAKGPDGASTDDAGEVSKADTSRDDVSSSDVSVGEPATSSARDDEVDIAGMPGSRAPAALGGPAPRGFVYGIAAAVGLVFLALELTWYRLLAPLLGGSTITFGLILATALAGIGVGGYLYSRRPKDRPVSLTLLATTLALEGVCALLPFAWGDDLALVVAHLRHFENLGYGHVVAGWLLTTSIVVFPAAVVSGYQFPLLFALLGRGRAEVAVHVGTTYAYNTAGVIAGSLLCGFVWIPQLGAVTTWRLLAGALLLLALLSLVVGARQPRGRDVGVVWLPATLAVVGALLLTTAGPGAVWRHTPIGAGRVNIATHTPNQLESWRRDTEASIWWQRDGVESSVALSVRNGLAFLVNGKADGSVGSDRATQAFLGLLPAMLHEQPERAFVIGLGTGMTAGLLADVPGVERVVVAELEPAILEVAREARGVNGDVLNHAKVEIQLGDGRELLLTARESFDLIISEPSNPYRAGIASLFTREFYQATRARLAPGGLFTQWLQGYEIDAHALSIAITTIKEVYPHVSIWGPEGNDLLLIASEEPQVIDLDRLRRVTQLPHLDEWMLRAWNMQGAEAVIAHHLVPPQHIETLMKARPAPINTDDLNHLEFAFARRVGEQSYSAMNDLFEALQNEDTRPAVNGEVRWAQVADLRHRAAFPGYVGPPPSDLERAVQAGCRGEISEADASWPRRIDGPDTVSLPDEPSADSDPSAPAKPPPDDDEPIPPPTGDVMATWVYALVLAERGDGGAEPLADRLEKRGFRAEAAVVRAALAITRGEPARATPHLVSALDVSRRAPFGLCDTLSRALDLTTTLARQTESERAALTAALDAGPFVAYLDEDTRRYSLFSLSLTSGDPQECVRRLGDERARPHWEITFLTQRAVCLREAGAPDAPEAASDVTRYLSREPITFHDPLARFAKQPQTPKVPATPPEAPAAPTPAPSAP
ncbi:MAG: fused MFS/spermidine synthase [Polyangiaceae bacterium]|nr:fused MFS/spermidine synthase [Polyangiaceae bacterium]MCW5792638.1 fused MFS/spermidine synthase [Polyangiaceae bacterium]